VRDEIFFDEQAYEVEVGLRRGGKAYLDLLEPHLDQRLEEAPLAMDVHRVDQSLVAIAEVDAAPGRRRRDHVRRPAPVGQVDRREWPVLLDRHSLRPLHWSWGSSASVLNCLGEMKDLLG